MTAHLDYKFRQIIHNDSGTSVVVTIYEGDESDGTDDAGNPIKVYQRTKLIETHHLRFRGDLSHEELQKACNERLAVLCEPLPDRTPLPVQEVKEPSTALLASEQIERSR